MNLRSSLILATVCAASTSALAIPTSLEIDFRDGAWSAAAGQTTKQIGDVTAHGFGVIIPLLGNVGPRPLSWNGPYGLGVDSNSIGEDPTEIGFREVLALTFDNGVADWSSGAWVTKLFTNEGLFGNKTEEGYVELYVGGSLPKSVTFTGEDKASDNPLGDVFVDFGGHYDLSGAKFYAKNDGVSDYSVAGLKVPDGGTPLLLLGAGLVSVGAIRRRR